MRSTESTEAATSRRVMAMSSRRRRVILGVLVVVAALGVLGTRASAQFQMPDPKEMSGIPRPVGDLPNATVSVRLIRGQLSNNITGFPVELHVGSDVRTVKTDDGGRAEFGNLPPGTTVKAVAVVDGERLESQEFPVPAQGGIRLMLVATDRSAKAATEPNAPPVSGQVVIGGQSRILVEPADEAVAVYYVLDVVNNARVPVNPTTPFAFDMPKGATGTTLLDGSSPLAKVADQHVQVAGPFPPGRTVVQVAAQLANTNGTVEVTQRFPANLEQLSVIVRKVGDVKVSSPQLAQQQEMNAQGDTYIAGGGGPVAAGQPIALTIDNLPHHSVAPMWTALGLAALIVIAGVLMSRSNDAAEDRAAERKRLLARRDKMFGDLVRLEQDHRTGKIGDQRYTERREALIASLEQVYGALDVDDTGPEPADRAA